jgi:hypothetical protein
LSGAFAPAYVVPLVGETALCLWLLIRGVNEAAWRETAAASGVARFGPGV